MLQRNLLLAQTIWQAGFIATITLCIYLFQRAEIAFLYTLLPLMATIIIGGRAGIIAESIVIILVWWLNHGLMHDPPSPILGWAILAGGAFTAFLGWAITRSLITTTQWALYSLMQSQKNLAEARQHRAQVLRLLRELDQAYYRLERANSALVAAWKAADEAERFKTEFVTNVSHELRTPLNLIVGFSEMMITAPENYGDTPLPGPYRGDINAIYQSAKHLLALVNDVLDLARIDVGKLALARDAVDIAALIAEATDMVRDYITAKGLKLHVRVADGLPTLWVDRLRIRQVLLNLLVNAARFTERGSISVEATRQGEEVMIRVTDTGRGIAKHDLPRVFEEFRTTDELGSHWHSGTGLGLPISKKFVELHHGRMGVESTYLEGSTFWFTLPCAPPSSLDLTPVRRERLQPPLVRLGAAERIVLVVHDDPHIAPLLQRYLDGYRVIGVPNWQEGMALAQEVKAIALVTDATEALPTVSGDVLQVRCPLPDSRRMARAIGARDLLVKPVSRQHLMEAIDRLGRPIQRVLIADDDPELVRLFRRMLHERIARQDCLVAHNGAETLQIMRSERPDLVLLDLMMPEVDGWQVLQQVAADPNLADIPVIVISVLAQDHVGLQLHDPIEVFKPQGFQLGEIVRALDVLFNSLAAGWNALGSKAPDNAEESRELQASGDTPSPPASAPVAAH